MSKLGNTCRLYNSLHRPCLAGSDLIVCTLLSIPCSGPSLERKQPLLHEEPCWAGLCSFQAVRTGSSYHALFTLDHQAFVPVHSTNATDDIVILVVGPSCMVVVAVVTFQRIGAVGLADRLANDLIDLDGRFVSCAVVSFPQAAYISAYR